MDSVDLVADLALEVVVRQATIHLVVTILPAIIIRMIKKTFLSANHTKRVTIRIRKTTTNNSNSWVPQHKYDDIHPMK